MIFLMYYKRILLRILLLFFIQIQFFSLTAGNNEQVIGSAIDHVTVFRNKAQISRQAPATVKGGITLLKIQGLSGNIDQNSIQVSGSGEAVIKGVTLQKNHLDQKEVPREIQALKARKEALQLRLDSLQNYVEVLEHEEDLFLSNKKLGGENGVVDPEYVNYMADLYRSRLMKNKMMRLRKNKTIDELQKEIHKIDRQINEANQQTNQSFSELVITLSSNTSTKINLKIDYLVYDAGWNPVYDIRASGINEPVDLVFKANVFQNTGIDWQNVKLTLSTRHPSKGGTVPELDRWYLDIDESPKRRQTEVDHISLMKEREPEANALKKASDYVSKQRSALAVTYNIAMPYTIASNGKSRMVDVQNFTIHDVKYKYYSIPKASSHTHLMVKVTNWEQYDLLPGRANIYFQGTFVGKTSLDPSSTNQKLDISLGKDERVVVKREKNKDYSITRTLGLNTKSELGYNIILKNNRNKTVNLKVVDQIPVSKSNKVEVTLEDKGGAVLDKETGKLTWDMSLEPGENHRLSFRFTVKYPKNEEVSGL